MQQLPRALYTAQQVRELDRRIIEDHGVDGFALMQRAGAAAFDVLRRKWPQAHRIGILAGKGNNGGDGYVIAMLAARAGLEVTLCRVGDHENLQGAAQQARQAFELVSAGTATFERDGLPSADIYVDALLGTGVDRALGGAYRDAVEALNAAGKPVLAIDVPSGADSDTGAVWGSCVHAKATVSFIGLKLGLFTGPALNFTGEVLFDPLGASSAVYANLEPTARRISNGDLARWLGARKPDAHKGDFGHVLIAGGNRGMAGAARLAGEAALRAGAGLVSLVVHPDSAHACMPPELMVHGIELADELPGLFDRITVLALGPGLGTNDWSQALWRQASISGKPMVLDADGLNLLAANKAPPKRAGDLILTPHPGEAARLLDIETKDVQSNRPHAVRELARRFDGVAVLKGAGTLVAEPGGGLWLSDCGNPGMASGGMGDALTGIIAGFLAQGLKAHLAACAGVLAHGLAGGRAAGDGERGLVASDLINALRAVVNP